MSKSRSTESWRNKHFPLAIVVLALCALWIRVSGLEKRPFHCDEAVQAVKFGSLLEDWSYEYDPFEYHGPTLYYLSLPIAWITAADTLEDVNESQLRMLPAMFGTGLILLLLLAGDGLGWRAATVAAALTAISPFMVYYSRYYIQEMLLIFFTLGALLCGWRYVRNRRPFWAVLAGLCLGLMFATKETCVIAWFSMAVALLLTAGRDAPQIFRIRPLHILLAVVSAVFIAALFFSSFGAHPEGIFGAVSAFTHYLARASGEGHAQPWHYYSGLLFWHREQGSFWSELLILVLAVYGGLRAFSARFKGDVRLPRFLSFYTLTIFLVYSAIPYKTPWLALGFLQPAIMLAGLGAVGLFADLRGRTVRGVCALLMLVAAANLAFQTWRGSFYYYADERNPSVYAHTSTDMPRFARQLREIADLAPAGRATTVKVIAPEYWPLPWYLRDFERVGYWHSIPADPQAPIIITAPEMAEEIESRLEGEYFNTMAGLRPGVVVFTLIRQDLWDAYLEALSL